MKLNLTAESLRALLVVEHTLNDLADVLSATIKLCRKHKTLAGVPEVLDVLQRFEAELDKHHPCDLLLPSAKDTAD
jgi:hypothetical protein